MTRASAASAGVTSVLEADLTWTGSRFERGVRVEVDAQGVIAGVRRGADEPPQGSVERLAGRALLPGFVNAHSHAFQRGLRGLGETFPAGAGSFWTWRESMYDLVESMDADRLHELMARAFREMRRAGITTVGEFHYLHHDANGRRFAFDEVAVHAARDAGIRLVLLNAYYRNGGINEPLEGGQCRFDGGSLSTYWSQMDRLERLADGDLVQLGCVAHSVRAVDPDEIALLKKEADRRGYVMHIHLEEQPQEIEACLRAYGRTPMALVNDLVDVDERMTAVHCTHTTPGDMTRYLGAGVCICPLTEANLGDGLADAAAITRAGGRICLGTDSNARISMIEEMRWLEYGQRLRTLERGALADDDGEVARGLLASATRHGADALGVSAGSIETGRAADFVIVDLNAPELDGWTSDTLLPSLVFGAGDSVIDSVRVGGQ